MAPTLVFHGRALHVPGKLALVAPYGFAAADRDPWFGLIVRLIGEFNFGAREAE